MTRTRIAIVSVTLAWVACATLSPIPTGPVPATTPPGQFDPEVALPHQYPNLIVVGFKFDSKGSSDAILVRGYDERGNFAPSVIAVVGPFPTAGERANFEVALRKAFGATDRLMSRDTGGVQPLALEMKSDGGAITEARPGPPPPPISLMEVGYLSGGASGTALAGTAGAVTTDDLSRLFENARAINDSAQKTFLNAPMK